MFAATRGLAIVILVIGIGALGLAGYTFFIVLPPSLDGIDKTASALTNFKMPTVGDGLSKSATEVRNAGGELKAAAFEMITTADALHDQVYTAGVDLASTSNNVNNIATLLGDTSSSVSRIATSIPQSASAIDGAANHLTNLGWAPFVGGDLKGMGDELHRLTPQLTSYANDASQISSQLSQYSTNARSLANSASAIGGDVQRTSETVQNGIYGLASRAGNIGTSAYGIADQMDKLGFEMNSASTNIESQVQQTGHSLYGFKSVFLYGLLSILAVAIIGVLTGVALLAFTREVSTQRLLLSAPSIKPLSSAEGENLRLRREKKATNETVNV